MDRNLILAVVLSALVYLGWFKFIEARYGKEAPPAAEATASAAPEAPAPEPAFKAPEPEPAPRKGGLDGALPFKASGLEVKVQPFGAGLVSYEYPGPLGRVELVDDAYPGYFASFPDLSFSRVGGDANWPAFEARHPSGAVIRKEYIFSDRDGLKNLRFTFTNPGKAPAVVGAWALAMGPALGTIDSERKENTSLWRSIALAPAPEGKTKPVFTEFDLEKGPTPMSGPWLWAGISNRYFLAAAFASPDDFTGVVHGAKPVSHETTGWLGGKKMAEVLEPWIRFEAKPRTLAPGETAVVEVPFYFGPKSYTHLSSFGRGLERSVSFGWFHIVGRFTLKVLHKFHSWTGNWGWAIIMLTLCLQVVLLPLSYKQMKSMAGMKKVQPEVQRIQQKFAKDPQRLQQEMMEVYKKHGVNPLGGCLPIIFQMPIFVALFNMLRGAWELHGAPWLFWIHDLSAHDPYYILPIVMGGIMFAQNKMNPQPTTDPTQAQMMTFMPIIFTFMFLNFPAGLVLYWLTNSVIGFIFQIAMKKRLEA